VGYWGKIAPAAILVMAIAIFALCPGCTNGHRSGPDYLVVTTYSLPDAIIGVAYEAILTATRKHGPYSFSWSLDDGSSQLPNGLTISAGGMITGTPTIAGTFSFVVKVTDNAVTPAQVATMALAISVTGQSGIIISSNPDPLPTGSLGIAYTASLTAMGGTPSYSWSIDTGSPPLPPGISLSSGGHFTGTPTQSGSYSFVVKVIDSTIPVAVVDSAPVTIDVSTAGQVIITTSTITKGIAGQVYSFLLSATGGTSPYFWSLASGSLPAGFSLNNSTGQISGTTSESGLWSFNVIVTDSTPVSPGKYTKDFSLQIDPAFGLQISNPDPLTAGQDDISYVEVITATGGTEPFTFSLDAGTLPTGLNLSESGILSGVPSEPGTYAFVIKVIDSTTPLNAESVKGFSLTIDPTGYVTIQQETLPDAVQNNLYQTSMTAVGGTPPYTWSIPSGTLPTGVTLGTDGLISGTPVNYGQWSFVIQSTDSATTPLSSTKPLSLLVKPELEILTTALPDALLNDAYSFSLTATGGTAPYSWTLDTGSPSLPASLLLSTGGHITGTPSSLGNSSFAIKVTDSSSPQLTASKAFTIGVKELVITTLTMPGGNWGQMGYVGLIKIKNGIPGPVNWQWSLKPGSAGLPPNLILILDNPTTGYGLVTGDIIPGSGTQTYTFTVEITETNSGTSDDQELSITINP
jgi:hypothetical protein